MLKKSPLEVIGRKAESTLEERAKHHNLICVGCWDVFPSSRTPLEHDTIWDKAICNKFANFTLIRNGLLKKVQSGHGGRRNFFMTKN
jgi:hypothetical protein